MEALHKKESQQKYRQSLKGKEAQKRANKKYQQTEKYKEYKRRYYLMKCNEERIKNINKQKNN
jgi:hypothetical protein